MEFIAEYAVFLAKTATVVVAVLIVLVAFITARSKGRRESGQLHVKKINEFYDQLGDALDEAILSKSELKAKQKMKNKETKQIKKNPIVARNHTFVIDFDGDIKASATENLRHEVTAILARATTNDEVVLRLESGGGMVHSYGLASSQLARIRDANIPLTICIDKVAASGGYMMACIAHKIIAAPFAILGSIGVVAQLPNIHRLLKKHNIDFEILTAGEYKRTLTMLGENTDKGREKFKEDLETTHHLFKDFVSLHRPQLNITEIATGEIWLGTQAQEKLLVDELKTSDEYLASCAQKSDLFHLHYIEKKSLTERVGLSAASTVDGIALTWIDRLSKKRFF